MFYGNFEREGYNLESDIETVCKKLNYDVARILSEWGNSADKILFKDWLMDWELEPVILGGLAITDYDKKVVAGALKNGISEGAIILAVCHDLKAKTCETTRKQPIELNESDKRVLIWTDISEDFYKIAKQTDGYSETALKRMLIKTFYADLKREADGLKSYSIGNKSDKLVRINRGLE